MNRRCVITGMGVISPVGNNVNDFWNNLKNGVNGIDFITKIDTTEHKGKVAAEVKNFNPEDFVSKKEIKRNDMYCLYALAASQEAYDMSGLKMEEENPLRVGVIVGSGIGGLKTIEEQVIKFNEKGPSKVSPLFVPMSISNMAAGTISIRYGTKGISSTIVTACATGTHSIGEAFRYIKHGYLDACFAGGSEAPITNMGVAGFSNLNALTLSNDPQRASIPFDKERNGFVVGEGSGIVMLEELEHAKKRGAKIYGEVVGYGATSDAYHITAPALDGMGAANAMMLAIEEAGIKPCDVSYINAHGTSTPPNDSSETFAIKKVFGDDAYKVVISSTKSMTGHLLGAAGAIEAITCIKAAEDNFVPPTINYKVKDEECDLDYVPNKGRSMDVKYAISNSFGFGGHNAVLCFKKWEE